MAGLRPAWAVSVVSTCAQAASWFPARPGELASARREDAVAQLVPDRAEPLIVATALGAAQPTFIHRAACLPG